MASKAPLKYGIKDDLLVNFNPDTTVLNQVNTSNKCIQNQRLLVSKDGKEIKRHMEFIDVMKFQDLMAGNYFGGRMLMPFEHYINIRRFMFGESQLHRYYPKGVPKASVDAESDEKYHTKSLLSVVANSAKVKVWIVDKQDMNYLPEPVQKKLFENIVLCKEEDRPCSEQDIEFLIKQFEKWSSYKIKMTDRLVKEH